MAATAVRDQAISSTGALARFEFETGKGNEGSKILMVEWNDDDDESPRSQRKWLVSWEGQGTTLWERDGAAEGRSHRVYFFLGPGVSVPRIVKIAHPNGKTMQTNPLPAIFPPQLGVSARTAGKKGVLHTIWGRKRLASVQREIDLGMKNGGDAFLLNLAIERKERIEDNFGIGPRYEHDIPEPQTPSSPKSPGGGRLAEKLKGLKLGTSTSELSTRPSGRLMRSLL